LWVAGLGILRTRPSFINSCRSMSFRSHQRLHLTLLCLNVIVAAGLGVRGLSQNLLHSGICRWFGFRCAPPASQLPSTPPRYAYVTIAFDPPSATSGTKLWAALPWARALRRMSSQYEILILTNTTRFPDGTDVSKAFSHLNVTVLPVQAVDMPERLTSSMSPDKREEFLKLQIWRLTRMTNLSGLPLMALHSAGWTGSSQGKASGHSVQFTLSNGRGLYVFWSYGH